MRYHLLFVHPLDIENPNPGGANRNVLNLIDAYRARKDIKISLIGVQFGKDKGKYNDVNKMAVIKNSDDIFKFYTGIFLSDFLPDPKIIIIFFRFDLFPVLSQKFPKNKKVLIMGGVPLKTYFKQKFPKLYVPFTKIYISIQKLLLKSDPLLVFTDTKTKNVFFEAFFAKSRNIRVLYSPSSSVNPDRLWNFQKVSTDKINELSNKYSHQTIITFLGRMEPVKNPLEFVKICERLIETNKELKFLMIGEGSEKAKVKDYVERNGLQNYFIFINFLSHEEVIVYLTITDYLLLTSKSEGSPTVVKEALVLGTKVISNDVGDVKDILRNENLGIIIKGSIEDKVKIIQNYLNNNIESSKTKQEFLDLQELITTEQVANHILCQILENF